MASDPVRREAMERREGGAFRNQSSGDVTIQLHSIAFTGSNGETVEETVRSAKCQLLAKRGRCTECVRVGSTLRRAFQRCAAELRKPLKHRPAIRTKHASAPAQRERAEVLASRGRRVYVSRGCVLTAQLQMSAFLRHVSS